MRRIRELAVALIAVASPIAARAQAPADTMAFYRAMDLEGEGKYREAAPLFRQALHTPVVVNALLGLERTYGELGWADSLLAPLDTLIAASPREPVFRSVQLRTLQTLGHERELRDAFERWTRAVPSDPTPYREYARILLQRNQASAADSVLRRGAQAVGSGSGMALEVAQTRAALGLWQPSAESWRIALSESPYLTQAAAYALAPAPADARDGIRQALAAPPAEPAPRRALADLELTWGHPSAAWDALADLRPDSASAAVWVDFAQRAESEERWGLARSALVAALRWKPTPELALRAANAALDAGDPAAALTLAAIPDGLDSAHVAREYVPIRAQALARIGRPAAAARLVEQYDHFIPPGARDALTRTIALGWVRSGDLARARATLTAAGAEGDSSDAAGWIALYDGDLATARRLLRAGSETTPELALALGTIARVHADSARDLGAAFLQLARGDSAHAATALETAAERYPTASSILLLTAAQIHDSRGEEPQAFALWQRIVERDSASAEAPEAELDWARALHRKGDAAQAVSHLEHLILTYPQSALVPEARRELDVVRKAVPGNA